MRYPNFLLLLLSLFVPLGCTQKEQAAIRLNDIEVTAQEFNAAFADSSLALQGDAGRKEFLEQFISKKMILSEAEHLGLDRDPQFLADIQRYWEQELLKRTLAKANSQGGASPVTDADIEAYYMQKKQEFFATKELSEVKVQIKDFLARERQKVGLQQWMEGIKQRTKIEIDHQRLGL